MTVLSKVVEKCKVAMRAGIPVIYIKTDSYQFIRDLVYSDELVVLLAKNSKGILRPYEEFKGMAYSVENWKVKMDSSNTWACPQIVTIDVSGNLFVEDKIMQYVKNYLDNSNEPDKKNLQGILKSSAVILYGSQIEVSRNLLQYCEIIELDYPEFDEIQNIAKEMIEDSGQHIEDKNLQQLCGLLQGFTVQEMQFAMNKVLTCNIDATSGQSSLAKALLEKGLLEEIQVHWNDKRNRYDEEKQLSPGFRKVIQDQKEKRSQDGNQLLKVISLLEEVHWNYKISDTEIKLSSGARKVIQSQKEQRLQDGNQVLKLISPGDKEIGGMEELTDYINKIVEQRLIEDAEQNKRLYGVRAPKGILLCGIPGCGKSLAAKLTAQKLNLTLLQMDMGNLMGGIQGQSEENMRKALSQVEAMSPCVLWIDELEKGFSGAKSDGASDGGTFKRMFATLLNWMQENTKPCFIFATANDIGGLPKELFRSGRFDELFGVFLPTADECADIFVKHVRGALDTTKENRKEASLKQLIAEEALEKNLYLNIINECMFEGKNVRIIIGSDIEKIVNSALAEFCQDIRNDIPIFVEEWKDVLKNVIKDISVYGDSPENIDSIAVGYCRMLRKGLRPTVKDPLFRIKDYHYERALNSDGDTSEAEQPVSILDRHVLSNKGRYDSAVYDLLYVKINEVAKDIEKYERRRLV